MTVGPYSWRCRDCKRPGRPNKSGWRVRRYARKHLETFQHAVAEILKGDRVLYEEALA